MKENRTLSVYINRNNQTIKIMDKNFHNVLTKNFMSMLDVLYTEVKNIINENGGFINTSGKGDKIYSLEFISGDTTEYRVIGVRVIDDRIEICSANVEEEVSNEELENCIWDDLIEINGYYIQTLYNIFEGIGSYVKKS